MHSGRRFAKQTAERSEQSFRTPKKKCKIFFETCLRITYYLDFVILKRWRDKMLKITQIFIPNFSFKKKSSIVRNTKEFFIFIVSLSVFAYLSSVTFGAPLPDFSITSVDIRFSTENPVEGESVTITAYVSNKGGEAKDDIEVRFFEGTPDEWGLQIEKGDIIIGLGSGRKDTADVKWRAKAGSKEIYVVVDPDNAIAEANEDNNQASCTITSRALTFLRPNQTEIKKAIQKGLDWLRTQQGELYVLCPDGHENPALIASSLGRCINCGKPLTDKQVFNKVNPETKGGWNPLVGPGATALVLLAFLYAGVPESDQTVSDGIDYLLYHTPVPNWENWTDSYDFAAGVLALQATGNKHYLEKVTYVTERLLKMQTYGGWGYGAYPDMAHMQYVLFALYAAQKWEIQIPEDAFKQVIDWVRSQQRKDGGWGYGGLEVGPWAASSYGSMTATALMIFKICGIPTTDPQFQKGLEWLKRHYTVTSNPGAYDWDYYYLLAIQRAMTIPPEQPLIGENNWYEQAAAYLLSQQRPDGSWEAGAQEAAIMATPFVILFLTKALP
jgi:squalene-hopene/tetraprenyl-beta-curcumene cyclase